ncbi:MAG: glycosyltransferase family 2 protein, partial [Thermodesulfobacteriota bacterium]|nr:glycosyltransferase family 2 protein [Thermodesulfobacteriota bacterium]
MSKDRKFKVLLVIPLFNHGGTLASVVHAALATGLHVLVVDDGSTDGGLHEIEGLPCKCLQFPVNQGKGMAILAGTKEAKRLGFDAILTLDADGQHDPSESE